MYIQITTKCNMTCEHCGFNCTREGQNMTLKTFKNALEYESECITIGGGEPTIHPKFWEILGIALGSVYSIDLTTNGSITDTSLALARMAKKGIISCSLSQDAWHDKIDQKVIDAFTKEKQSIYDNNTPNDYRGIRTITEPISSGRWWGGTDECFCEDLFVCPNGDVKPCGCEDAPIIGNVNTGFEYDYELYEYQCYKKVKSLHLPNKNEVYMKHQLIDGEFVQSIT
jgi:MoaA/NifB/PqqE/SkfB family radical SAM enzyme